MASSVIHMAVANEVNKTLKRNNNAILIGSIAPDISKQVGQTKLKSHFLDEVGNDIPNISRFLEKYKNSLNDDFVMGYFIHLYTDYLWFKYFMTEIYKKDVITKLDGTKVKCSTSKMLCMYIYNDYTNMNSQVLDAYDMDLSIFYNELPEFKDIIKEIPMNKLKVIQDQASIIIENSKIKKDYIFNIENIKKFIDTSVDLTLSVIKDIENNSYKEKE